MGVGGSWGQATDVNILTCLPPLIKFRKLGMPELGKSTRRMALLSYFYSSTRATTCWGGVQGLSPDTHTHVARPFG